MIHQQLAIVARDVYTNVETFLGDVEKQQLEHSQKMVRFFIPLNSS
jgi:hypothetical protein